MAKLIISGGGATTASHSKYISRAKGSETYIDEKILFNDEESNLTEWLAVKHLSREETKDQFIKLVFSTEKKDFNKLGETKEERLLKMETVVREGLENLWEKLGVKNVKWIAGTHLNTGNPHTHIIFNTSAFSIETGEKIDVPKIPRSWFWRENNDNSVLAKLFVEPIAANSIATPPESVRTKKPITEVFLPVREFEPDRVEKTLHRLSQIGGIAPHLVEHLTSNQSLYVSRQGALTFVRRDVAGYATGYVYENGYQPEDEKGFFYVGNPKTATRFIIAETPKEVLAALELISHRDLSEVCLVASDKKNVPLALTEHLKEISTKKPVRIIWSLGLNRDGVQETGNYADLQVELLERRPENSPTLEFYAWQPKAGFGHTWNYQVQSRNHPGEIKGIITKVLIADAHVSEPLSEAATQSYYQQVAVAFRDVDIRHEADTFIVSAKTLEGVGIEYGRYIKKSNPTTGEELFTVNSVDGDAVATPGREIEPEFYDETEAVARIKYLFGEKISAEFLQAENAMAQRPAETETITPAETQIENATAVIDDLPNLKLTAREKTERLKEIPLEDVMPYLGLSLVYDQKRREYVYRDNGKANKIKVTGDLFCDRYHDNRGGKNAINFVMHIRGDNFNDARQFLIDHLGWHYIPQDTKEKAVVRQAAEKEKAPFVMPSRNENKLPVIQDYLTNVRGLNANLVNAQIEEGNVYANNFGSVTFVYKNEDGIIKGAAWRAVTGNKRGDYAGTEKVNAWFYLGDIKTATRFIIVEAPIEAMSYAQLHPDIDLTTTAIISTATNSVPAGLINLLEKNAGERGELVIAFNNDKGGMRGTEFLLEKTGRMVLLEHKDHHLNDLIETTAFSGRILREIPHLEDWNEDVKAASDVEHYENDAEGSGSEIDSISRPAILPQTDTAALDSLQIISMESSSADVDQFPIEEREFPISFNSIGDFNRYIQAEKKANTGYKTEIELTFDEGSSLNQTFLIGKDLPDTLSTMLDGQIEMLSEMQTLPAFDDRNEELETEIGSYKYIAAAVQKIYEAEIRNSEHEDNPEIKVTTETIRHFTPEMIRTVNVSAPIHFQGIGKVAILLAREDENEKFFNLGYRIEIGSTVIEKLPDPGSEKFAQGKQSLSNAYDEVRLALLAEWKKRGQRQFTLNETQIKPDENKYVAYLLNKAETFARDFSVRSFEKSFAVIPEFSETELNILRQWKNGTTNDDYFKIEEVFYKEIPNARVYQNLMYKLVSAGLVEVKQDHAQVLVKGGNPLTAKTLSYLSEKVIDELKMSPHEARVLELQTSKNEYAAALLEIGISDDDRDYLTRRLEMVTEELDRLNDQAETEKKSLTEGGKKSATESPESVQPVEINLGENPAADYQVLKENPLKGIYDLSAHRINVAFNEAYQTEIRHLAGFEFNYRNRLVTVLETGEDGILLNFRIADGRGRGKNQYYNLGNLIHEEILDKASFEKMMNVARTRQEIVRVLQAANMNMDYRAQYASGLIYTNSIGFRINSRYSEGDFVLIRNEENKSVKKSLTLFKQKVETTDDQKVYSFDETETAHFATVGEALEHLKEREILFEKTAINESAANNREAVSGTRTGEAKTPRNAGAGADVITVKQQSEASKPVEKAVTTIKPLTAASTTGELENGLTGLLNDIFEKANYDFTVKVVAAKEERGAFDIFYDSTFQKHAFPNYRVYPPSPEFDEWSALKNKYNPLKAGKTHDFEVTDKSFETVEDLIKFTAKRIIKNENLEQKAAKLIPTILASKDQEGRIEKRIAKILHAHGLAEEIAGAKDGFYVRLENQPFMDLHITRDEGTNLIRLTHWYVQNGDMMHDGEMNFRLNDGKLSLNQVATALYGVPQYAYDRSFANMFSNNLIQQGFGRATLRRNDDKQSDSQTGKEVEASERGEDTLNIKPVSDLLTVSSQINDRTASIEETNNPNHLISQIEQGADAEMAVIEIINPLQTRTWLPDKFWNGSESVKKQMIADGLAETGRTGVIFTDTPATDLNKIHGETIFQFGLEGDFTDDQIANQMDNTRLMKEAVRLNQQLDTIFANKSLVNPWLAVAETGSGILEIRIRQADGTAETFPVYGLYQIDNKSDKWQIAVGREVPQTRTDPADFDFDEPEDLRFDYETVGSHLSELLLSETNLSTNRVASDERVALGTIIEPSGVKGGTIALAEEVREILHSGASIGNNIAFNKIAERNFGGTRAAATFSARDAYDALELGVNLYLLDRAKETDFSENPGESLRELRDLLRRLPTQTDRTDEQNLFQQFSTPPTESFAAFIAAGIKKKDLVLEPSAGNGGLALWAKAFGAEVHVNEISDRRAGILKILGFNEVSRKDAQFLNDTLDQNIKPTLILMNPPFSATGGRTTTNRTKYGAEHITDALDRLTEGGRLVAIVSEGMSFDRPTFTNWWASILNKYTVRANIGVPGEEYGKYGTNFGNQMLVIDKIGATPGNSMQEQLKGIVKGNMPNLETILIEMEKIAELRPDPKNFSLVTVNQEKAIERRNLLLPETIDLSPTERIWFYKHQEELSRLGFETIALSGRTVAIKTIPENIGSERVKEDFLSSLSRLENSGIEITDSSRRSVENYENLNPDLLTAVNRFKTEKPELFNQLVSLNKAVVPPSAIPNSIDEFKELAKTFPNLQEFKEFIRNAPDNFRKNWYEIVQDRDTASIWESAKRAEVSPVPYEAIATTTFTSAKGYKMVEVYSMRVDPAYPDLWLKNEKIGVASQHSQKLLDLLEKTLENSNLIEVAGNRGTGSTITSEEIEEWKSKAIHHESEKSKPLPENNQLITEEEIFSNEIFEEINAAKLFKTNALPKLEEIGYILAAGKMSNDAWAVLSRNTSHIIADQLLNAGMTLVPTQKTYDLARIEAAGAIIGRVDRLENRGYRIIFGEPDQHLQSELVGILSGQYADRFIEKGLSIEKITFNKIERQKFIKREDVQANPDKIYLFGDNLHQTGYGGQAAEMRGEKNAFGIPTKIHPNNSPNAFFTDDDLLNNKIAINEAFGKIARFAPDTVLVVPQDGLGTGLADLENRAPQTFAYLQERLQNIGIGRTDVKQIEEVENTMHDRDSIKDENLNFNQAVTKIKEAAGFSQESKVAVANDTKVEAINSQGEENGNNIRSDAVGNRSRIDTGVERIQPSLFELTNESDAVSDGGSTSLSADGHQSETSHGGVAKNQSESTVSPAHPKVEPIDHHSSEETISGSDSREFVAGQVIESSSENETNTTRIKDEKLAAQELAEAIGAGKNLEKRERIDNLGVVEYKPAKLTRGFAHPGDIVESASMAAVDPPDIKYTPRFDKKIIEDGLLSSLQLETVIYAGQRHEMKLGDGSRAGYFIGDGTGVGKGRELAGIALDNWNQGRKRILWLSINYDLVPSTERDMNSLGTSDIPLATLNKYSVHTDLEESVGNSLLFASYATLTGKGKDGKTRFDQIVKWLGDDGVIMFDEGHLAKNAVAFGHAEASQRGEAVIDLQTGSKSNPNWRFVYSSATGATELRNMAYMQRLGLWGAGSGFPGGFVEFHNTIDKGGLGASEMVARDMKAAGMYCSRSLSMRGVDYRSVHHVLTPEQKEIYNLSARAWSDVVRNFDVALKQTNATGKAKGMAYARLWSGQQMFYRQLMTALKVPPLIQETERILRDGSTYRTESGEQKQIPAQVVIGVIGTGEARTKEQVSKAMEFGLDLDNLDFSPKQILLNVVESAFPTKRFTEETDPMSGKTIKVPVVDEDGRQIESQEALRMRDELLGELEEKVVLPENPLDQIVNYFGESAVAEITGRNKRIIIDPETGNRSYIKRAREGVAMDKASQDEMNSFQAGRKRIAIISQSASTGISLHSELKPLLANYTAAGRMSEEQAKNILAYWNEHKDTEGTLKLVDETNNEIFRRVHITLETAWSADTQMQTFGRTHRSNELMPPEYVLMSTDLGGEKRFLSTIAKRLSSLGALTKGDREQAGGGNLLAYDFENKYGQAAAKKIITMLRDGKPALMSLLPADPQTGTERGGMDLLYTMGLAKQDGNLLTVTEKTIEDLEVGKFLNRVLMLDVDTQNAVFDGFVNEMEAFINHDKEVGLFDEGVKDIEGENIRLAQKPQVVSKQQTTGAETLYYKINADTPTFPVTLEEIENRNKVVRISGLELNANTNKGVFYQQRHSKNVVYTEFASTRADAATGAIVRHYKFARPGGWQSNLLTEKDLVDKYVPVRLEERREFADDQVMSIGEWWNKEVAETPMSRVQDYHLIAGAVLPVWQRLSSTNDKGDQMSLKTVRIETEDGTRIVGVEIPSRQINRVLRDLGVEQSFKTPEEIFDTVLDTKETIELVGGIRLRPTFLKKQPAIEIMNLSVFQKNEFQNFGAAKEMIGFESKFFVPTAKDKGVEVLSQILERYPAVDKRADSAKTADPGQTKDAFKTTVGGNGSANIRDTLADTALDNTALAKVSEKSNAFFTEVKELRDAPLSRYWYQMKADTNEKGQITINPAAFEFLRVAYKQTFHENILNFEGLFRDADQTDQFLQTLDEMEQQSGIYSESIASITKTIARARDKRPDKALILLTQKDAAIHEETHAASAANSYGRDLIERHARFDELVASEAYLIAKPILAAKHQTMDDGLLVDETIAYITEGEGEKIGLLPDEAADFGVLWYKSFAEKNGDISILKFKELTDESKQIRDRAYREIQRDRIAAERSQNGGDRQANQSGNGFVGNAQKGDGFARRTTETESKTGELEKFRADIPTELAQNIRSSDQSEEKSTPNTLYKLSDDEITDGEINDILESYGFSTPNGNDVRILARYVEKYPQAGEMLIGFAAERDLIKDERFEAMTPEQASDSSEARFEMYVREIERLNNQKLTLNNQFLYKTSDINDQIIKGDVIFTELQAILQEAGLEKALELKTGRINLATIGTHPKQYELEIADTEIKFVEMNSVTNSDKSEQISGRGITFALNTAGKFQYTGSIEQDLAGDTNITKFDKNAGFDDVSHWKNTGLGSRIYITEFNTTDDVKGEIEETSRLNLNKHLGNQLANELIAEIELRKSDYQLTRFSNNLDGERLPITITIGEKVEEREVSRKDLRRERLAIAAADVAGSKTSGILEMIAEDEKQPLEIIEKRAFAKAVAVAEQLQEPWSKTLNQALERKTVELTEKRNRAELRLQNVKNLAIIVSGQAGLTDLKKIRPTIAPEKVWLEQINAIRRGDAETFIKLEAIHQETGLPRPNAVFSRLRGMEAVAAEKERAERAQLAQWQPGKFVAKENIVINLRRENGELKVENWHIKEIEEKEQKLRTEAKENRQTAEEERITANRKGFQPIRNYIDPFSPVQGKLAWFTNPAATLNAHLNPIEIVKNTPAAQTIRAVAGYIKHQYKAGQLESLAQTQRREAEFLREKFAPGVVENAQMLHLAVKNAVQSEETLRAALKKDAAVNANLLNTPPPRLTDTDAAHIGQTAIETGDVTKTRDYLEQVKIDTGFAEAVSENAESIGVKSLLAQARTVWQANQAVEAIRPLADGSIDIELNPLELSRAIETTDTADLLREFQTNAEEMLVQRLSLEEIMKTQELLSANNGIKNSLNEQIINIGNSLTTALQPPLSPDEMRIAQELRLSEETQIRFAQMKENDSQLDRMIQQGELATQNQVPFQQTAQNYEVGTLNNQVEEKELEFWKEDRQQREAKLLQERNLTRQAMSDAERAAAEAEELAATEAVAEQSASVIAMGG